ncbi:hypothetical protein CF326_g3794 [Tilletia indica]|nr:hypothetical protein CF326_g3794 [Tilletia indica]
MVPTVAQQLKGRCGRRRIKTRHQQGRLSRCIKTTDGLCPPKKSGRAIGRLGRQDAGHGTTRSTARTDWVGNGCQGTFPFPQLERQVGGRLGQDEHGAGNLRIKVRDLSRTAWPVRRDEDLGRPQRTTIDDRPAHRSGQCLTEHGTVPQDLHDNRDGRRCGKRTDALRQNEGQLRARAARRSDGKTDNTAGKGISATRRSVRTERRLRRQDAGRFGVRRERTVLATFPPRGWSRKMEDDSVKTSTEQVIYGEFRPDLLADVLFLPSHRFRTPGSTSVTSQRRLGWADVMRTWDGLGGRVSMYASSVGSADLPSFPLFKGSTGSEPGLLGTRTARRLSRLARAARRHGKSVRPKGRFGDQNAGRLNVRRERSVLARAVKTHFLLARLEQQDGGRLGQDEHGADHLRINVRDLSETAWALRCDKALVRPGGRVDDRCMARAARRCARIKVRDLSETAWKTVRETTEGKYITCTSLLSLAFSPTGTVAQDPHENGNDR